MDTYFILVKIMIGTRKCGVAIIGTRARYVLDNIHIYIYMYIYIYIYIYVCIIATNIVFLFLFRSNWPPPEFSKRALYDKRYNILYYMNDPKGNFQMFRWIDYNIVKIIFNVHMRTKVLGG